MHITLKQVSILTSLTPATILDKIEWTSNAFPRPKVIGGTPKWEESDIMSWINKYRK